MLMVEAEHVQKTYRSNGCSVDALKNVNLEIEKGEMISIMGPSGCGKTTLLNCLSGLDDITSGTIKVEGTALESMSDRDRTRHRAQRMGFIFQSFNLLPVLSAVENVELPLLISGVDQKEARPRALDALETVGLRERASHKPSALSGGQQQRVTIARALINEPAIVWADEPTGNLDSQGARQVLDLMLQLNRENDQTFVVVTHDPTVGRTASRMIRMQDGAIVSEDIPARRAHSRQDGAILSEDAQARRARRLALQAQSMKAYI
ncbi:MAG: ABC transporter ATP-binding protein [Halobacteriota archaeon]